LNSSPDKDQQQAVETSQSTNLKWLYCETNDLLNCCCLYQCVDPENIHTLHVGSRKFRGVGVSEIGKFPKGRGPTQRVSFLVGVKCDWMNTIVLSQSIQETQTNRNVPSFEINIRFFVIYFPFYFRCRTIDGNPEHHVCWTSSWTKCRPRGAAIHEQWWYLIYTLKIVLYLT